MKILRIIARLNVGGPARHVVWLTSALQDDEFRSQLIAGSVPPGEDDMSYFAAENRVEPQYIHEMSREISLSDINSLLKIYRQIKAEKPDIIHTHTAKAGTLGRVAGSMYRWLTWRTLIGRPRKVRMVHTFHGHVFHSYYSPAKTKIFLWIERLLANASDRIIVISDQQFKEISSDFRIGNANKFSIVPLGIDLDAVSDDAADRKRLREVFGFDDNDVVVGFVGRLTEIKNLSLLLRTAALFKNDSDVKFAIIGDGHMRPSLEAEARELKLDGKLRFLGNRTDIAAVYGSLEIVMLTSLNEGTPLSLIEAMAAGKPVISTGVGGVKDLLGAEKRTFHGYTLCERGVRIDTFSPDDYQQGLNYLLENEAERVRVAEQGREFIRKKYSKERLIEDIKQLYRDLYSE